MAQALLFGIVGVALSFVVPGIVLSLAAGVLWWAIRSKRRTKEPGPRRRERIRSVPQLSTRVGPSAAPVLVPIFTGQEPLEALVPLAWLLGGREFRVQVVWIQEVPCHSPFWHFREHDAQVLTGFAQASEGQPSCSFEGVLTHRREEVLHERACDPETRWVVMNWQPRSFWRRVLFDPLTQFFEDPPCNLVVYRPAAKQEAGIEGAPIRPQRILVVTGPRPQDAALLQIASRVATWSDVATITVAHVAPLETTREKLHRIHSYHDILAPPGVTVRVHIVRSTAPLEAVLQLSEGFDVLVLGRSRRRSAVGWLRGFEDQLAARASCAVIQLRAGSDLPRSPSEDGPPISAALDVVEVVRDGSIASKKVLFRRMGQWLEGALGDRLGGSSPEQALWELDSEESTVLSHGVAAPHRTSFSGLTRIHIGLWILGTPVEFEAPGSAAVDLCFIVVGPPAERSSHRVIMERLGQLAALPPLLSALRSAETPEEARFALRTAEQGLHS